MDSSFGVNDIGLGRVSMHRCPTCMHSAYPSRVGVRVEARCTFSFFQEVNQNHIIKWNQSVMRKIWWCLNILEVIKLLVTESEWCLPRVHFVSCILVHILKRNNKGTQPWSKTNWPFSMENMSCRLGGGVPAYLPPLFLRTKQAMSATRVSSATAHMVPMNQPWVEKSLRWPTAPENKNGKGTQSSTHRLHTSTYLSMTVPSSTPHTTSSLTENRDTWWILVWEDVLTSHCLQL